MLRSTIRLRESSDGDSSGVQTCWIRLVSMVSAFSVTILKTLCSFYDTYKGYWLQKLRRISKFQVDVVSHLVNQVGV